MVAVPLPCACFELDDGQDYEVPREAMFHAVLGRNVHLRTEKVSNATQIFSAQPLH